MELIFRGHGSKRTGPEVRDFTLRFSQCSNFDCRWFLLLASNTSRKLPPSAWQLFFTDWIKQREAAGKGKTNVLQAAQEAGREYALLSAADKEVRLPSRLAYRALVPVSDVRVVCSFL